MSAENHITRRARATRLWTLAAVSLGGLLTAIVAGEAAFSDTSGETMWYRGKCQGVAGRRVAVEANGSRLKFEVEPHARITVDREDATLDDLRFGQYLEIEARNERGELLASVIDARSSMRGSRREIATQWTFLIREPSP